MINTEWGQVFYCIIEWMYSNFIINTLKDMYSLHLTCCSSYCLSMYGLPYSEYYLFSCTAATVCHSVAYHVLNTVHLVLRDFYVSAWWPYSSYIYARTLCKMLNFTLNVCAFGLFIIQFFIFPLFYVFDTRLYRVNLNNEVIRVLYHCSSVPCFLLQWGDSGHNATIFFIKIWATVFLKIVI